MDKNQLDKSRLPRHVAIIMDGNGRWAKKKLWNRIKGHSEGAESVDVITECARKYGVKYLTLYAFSTENWARPKDEVEALMKLLKEFLLKKRETLLKNKIRLNLIGSIERLPDEVRLLALEIVEETSKIDSDMTLTLALSYGSREEIIRATQKIAEKVQSGELKPEEITPEIFESNLYTHNMPDPDLVIRTSGEERISNYLLWQIAYSEIYITEVLWPDFRENEFVEALKNYASRERRFGKTSEQLSS